MGTCSESSRTAIRASRWRALRAAVVIGVLAVGAAACEVIGGADDRTGQVVRIVDGDTLIALVDGEETTIRLLNIDTPETKDPDMPVQCLGPEATAFLEERLPAGTEIELDYDEERLDPYDRTLAAVYESDSLINVEIAAAGLGVPVYFAPNDRFLPEVEEASRTAQEEERGLFSEEIECTIPSLLQAQSAAVEVIPATVTGDPADALAGATSVLGEVDVFIAAISVDALPTSSNAVLASPRVESFVKGVREEASDVRRRAVSAEDTLAELNREYDEEQERLEQERLEREEEERKQREEEERRQQEEERRQQEEEERQERQREQEVREQEEEERSNPPKAPEKEPSGSSSSMKKSSGSSSSGSSSSGGSSSNSGSGDSSESGGSSGSGCVPYGPEIPYSDDGGYTGKRHGMPGGKTFRKCS
ncbi:nuclease [Brachybacterium ginsengisoli]|uniref:Nuclease n=1 Tax=Brachybacterium ginsengisoli TaxID=1331682 RepID=A0A291H2N9_9MICO|nr:thermonuclease family protein [Brachybacterium ginsengisoli]ATG56680.1 nuclease [Brachybacterium ginsengisoli]